MSTPPVCPRCGSTNFVGARFCQNCGSPLAPPAQAATAPPVSPPTVPPTPPPTTPQPGLGAIPYLYGTDYASYAEQKRREGIDRTKTGLLLLITGTVIGPIPIIGLLGGIIALVGAILVIIGRNPFGKSHSDYVLWSVGLYIAGLVIFIAFTIGLALALVRAAITGGGIAGLSDAFSSNFNNFLVGIFIGGAVTGVANVLFTYALQKPMGRVVLWAAYVGSLALGVYTLSLIGSQVSSAVQAAFASGTFNRAPIDALQSQLSNLRLLAIVPSIIYAAAYYMAWSRISRNEIPSPPTPPSTLTGSIS